MTRDENGWDPERPGVPPHSERDWWHWLENKITKNLWCANWRSKESYWGHPFNTGDTQFVSENWRYLGGAMPPSEWESAKAEARRAALKEAAELAGHYELMAYQHGSLPVEDPHECAAQVAREIEASIRALEEKGLSSEEIIRADRDAWPDRQASDAARALKDEP